MSVNMVKIRQIKLFYKCRTGVDRVSKVSTILALFRTILSFLRQKCTNLREFVDTFDTSATPLRHPKCRSYYSMIPTVIGQFHPLSTLFLKKIKKAQCKKYLSYSVEGIKRMYA